MKTVLLFLSISSTLSFFSQALPLEWQRRISAYVNNPSSAVCQANDGGYILIGTTNDYHSPGFHGGSQCDVDILVTKLGAAGETQWQKCLGGIHCDFHVKVLKTMKNTFLIYGYTNSNNSGDVSTNHGEIDAWLVEIDLNGTVLREKCIGGSDRDWFTYISQTPDSGFIAIGNTFSTNGDVAPYCSSDNYWIVKLDANWNIEWQKSYGGTGGEQAAEIHPTADNGYITCGFTGSNDGDVSGIHGSVDYWVLKLDHTGSILWQKCLGGQFEEYANSICETHDGGYVVAGRSNSNNGDVSNNHGSADYWLTKLNNNGNLVWEKSYGGEDYDFANKVITLSNGNIAIAGESNSSNGDIVNKPGDYSDGWIVEINSNNGSILWQRLYYFNSGYDRPTDMQETFDKGLIFSGITNGDNGFNGNLWIVKLLGPTTSVEESRKTISYSISPNPANDVLLINGISNFDGVIINLKTVLGQTIYSTRFECIDKNFSHTIRLDEETSGFYFLELISGDCKKIEKFLIQK